MVSVLCLPPKYSAKYAFSDLCCLKKIMAIPVYYSYMYIPDPRVLTGM